MTQWQIFPFEWQEAMGHVYWKKLNITFFTLISLFAVIGCLQPFVALILSLTFQVGFKKADPHFVLYHKSGKRFLSYFGYSFKRFLATWTWVCFCSSANAVSIWQWCVAFLTYSLESKKTTLLAVWCSLRCMSELTIWVIFWMIFSEFAVGQHPHLGSSLSMAYPLWNWYTHQVGSVSLCNP